MNHDLRSIHRHQHLRAAGFVLCALLSPFSVSAGEVEAQDSAFKRFMRTTTGLGRQTVNYASNGTPITAPNPKLMVGPSGVNVVRPGVIPLRPGVDLAINTVSKIPMAAVATLIKRSVPYLGLAVVVGAAIYELASESGYQTKHGINPYLFKAELVANYTYSCAYGGSAPSVDVCVSRFEAAHRAVGSQYADCKVTSRNWGGNAYYQGVPYPNVLVITTTGCINSSSPGTRTKVGDVVSEVVTSWDAFANEIAAKSGWPSGSALARTVDELQRATGEVLPVEDVKVTGPATVTGPEEVTKTVTPEGEKTTTKQSDYECTYVDGETVMDGGSVICTERIRTKEELETTDPETQEKKKTTTKTEETKKPADPAENPTDCSKTPDASGCVKNEYDVPDGEIPKATKTITFSPINLGFSAGSCPADAVFTPHGMGPLKVIDWADNCSKIQTYVKPMILALATFGALMILFAGGRPE